MKPYHGATTNKTIPHPIANSPQLIRDRTRAHKPNAAPAPTKNNAGILVPAAIPKSAEARSHHALGRGVGSGEWETFSPLPIPHSPPPTLHLSQKTRMA